MGDGVFRIAIHLSHPSSTANRHFSGISLSGALQINKLAPEFDYKDFLVFVKQLPARADLARREIAQNREGKMIDTSFI